MQKTKAFSKIFFLITQLILCIFLFLNCVQTSKQNRSILEKKNAPRAAILYTSDSPSEFLHFSTFFTDKINQETQIYVQHNHELNKIWLEGTEKITNIKDVEKQIMLMQENLRNLYKKKQIKKLISTNTEYEDRFYEILSKNPTEIKHNVLSGFFFWGAVAEAQNHNTKKNSTILYQKYTSLSEKNLFELDVDENTIKNLELKTQITSKNIPIYSKSQCLIFVNGYQIQKLSINLPLHVKSVLSASCSEGSYSQIFTSSNTSSIIIDKFSNAAQIVAMPRFQILPKQLLEHDQINTLILIYWSKKLGRLEVKIIDTKNEAVVKGESFKLKSKNDFDEVKNKLILFLNEFFSKASS